MRFRPIFAPPSLLAFLLTAAWSVVWAAAPLRVGVFEFEPLVCLDKAPPDRGLFMELLGAVAAKEGWSIEPVSGSIEEGWTRLATGSIDLLVAAPCTSERRERFAFGQETVISTWAQVYTPPNAKAQTIMDLAGRVVAVVRDDPYSQELRTTAQGFNVNCRFVECKDYHDVFTAVANKWVDAGVVDRLYGRTHEGEFNVQRTTLVLAPVTLRFAAAKGRHDEVLRALDYALADMKQNPASLYHQLVSRAVGDERSSTLARHLLVILGVAVMAAILLAGVALVLRRQVRRRTAELVQRNTELAAEVESRRSAEAALRTSAQLLEQTFTSLSDAVLIADSQWERVLRCNQQAATVFGYPAEQLAELPLAALHPDADSHQRFEGLVQAELVDHDYVRLQMQLLRASGAVFPAEVCVSAIHDRTGEVQSWVTVVRDITAQVRATEALRQSDLQLRQAQKMEAIGTLAGGIAHDFNNLLQPILGHVELLQLDLPPDDPRQEALSNVRKAAERGRRLVQQILTFGRKVETENRPLRLNPIVKESLQFLRATLPSTIDIRHRIDAESDVVVADPVQVHQVLMNLCTNAAHAMREQGGVLEVLVSAFEGIPPATVADANDHPGFYVVLTVRDTGQGMAPEVVERIFEPFFTTKKPGEGTGMGLAVVHGIVSACGGRITVESQLGKGSTFRVFLPGIKVRVTAEEDTPRVGTTLRGAGTVLLVDDEMLLLEVVERFLRELGYKVVSCCSGQEAINRVMETPARFDVVVSDQTMPGMTGAELAHHILEIQPNIPIVLCSGYREGLSPDLLRDVGICEFLAKPFTIHELAEVLRRAVGTPRATAPPTAPSTAPTASGVGSGPSRSGWKDPDEGPWSRLCKPGGDDDAAAVEDIYGTATPVDA